MAHPYSTQARVETFLGPARLATLADRDSDGQIDAGLVADALERTANRLDGALAGRYVMPCAAITDSTPTPGSVADTCDIGVGALLYEWLAPSADDAKTLRAMFESQLKAYRAGTENVVGLTELTPTRGTSSVAFESIGTQTAGALDSSGDRTGAWSQTDSTDQARGI